MPTLQQLPIQQLPIKAANLNNTILGANYLKLIDDARQIVEYVIG